MADSKKEKALKRVMEEIAKINDKKNNVFFFVLDTKGVPSGSLEYIYNIALIAKERGYNVSMLYQENKDDEFVGVGDWLGEEYANIPHHNINSDSIEIGPSDILFIPEIFANVMNQTKKLPCKRIGIFQNYDFLVEQMPFAGQWGDFGILEAITNTKANGEVLNDIYPYVKTTVIPPYIKEYFGNTTEPKKMIVNIVARDQSDVNKIVKPFYWKYPSFKWVSFRDLRGFPKKQFAELMREAAITVWVDDETSFGYSALEALKSGCLVVAKMPDNKIEWALDDNDRYKNNCVWFDDFHSVHKIIANVVRSWTTNTIPTEIIEEEKKVMSMYKKEDTEKAVVDYLEKVISDRKKEMEELVRNVEDKD